MLKLLGFFSGLWSAIKALFHWKELREARRAGAADALNKQRGIQDDRAKKARAARDAAESVDPDGVLDSDSDIRD